MKFQCPKCKIIFKRDMRYKVEKKNLKKRGYLSYCSDVKTKTYAKQIREV